MVLGYVSSVLFSYMTHCRLSYRAKFEQKSFALFGLVQLSIFALNYLIVAYLMSNLEIDPRITQPLLALVFQAFALLLYSKIFISVRSK